MRSWTRRTEGAACSRVSQAMLFSVFLVCSSCPAQGPHEVLLLVNGKSPDSVEVAETYAKLRAIPPSNIVRLELPAEYAAGRLKITPGDFTALIWEPAWAVARKRGIDDHILAWLYSVDFPVKIDCEPVLSITGLTFLRNALVDGQLVERGKYVSVLFAGRNGPGGGVHFPQTLDSYSVWLAGQMPLPSMMLGHIGESGNTMEEVLECLRRGALSDGTRPEGTVYFVTGSDVRARARNWQYPPVRSELKMMGIDSVITNEFPSGQAEVLGILTGAARVIPSLNSYVPGSMAEHLTSSAAVFEYRKQSKVSEWIKAGVTATAGTVTEPYALWTKFPDARFYVYYASGCTALESFYQSVRCPLQQLMLGDALARPWADGAEIILAGVEKIRGSRENVKISVDTKAGDLDIYGAVMALVDGRIVALSHRFVLCARDFTEGSHTLRVVAYRAGVLRNQVFVRKKFTVKDGKISF